MGRNSHRAPVAGGRGEPIALRLEPGRVSALVPCHREAPARSLVEQIRQAVGDVLLVDDGCPEPEARAVERLVAETRVALLRLPANAGKGHAVAAGLRHLLGSSLPPQAVLVLDADGQHPPASIRAFLTAATDAELVIGDRFGDLAAMPWRRRLANQLASRLLGLATGQAVRDSQCGMRLLSGRALFEVEFPEGGYESETRHLKRCLRSGVRIAWVPIPALYEGQQSSFRSIRDTLRILGALLN